jgi:hypothetical protein
MCKFYPKKFCNIEPDWLDEQVIVTLTEKIFVIKGKPKLSVCLWECSVHLSDTQWNSALKCKQLF